MATATNVTVIPAKPQTANNRSQYKQLRVAAYCRVSTEQEEQQNSYQVQIEYYTDLIHSKKEEYDDFKDNVCGNCFYADEAYR